MLLGLAALILLAPHGIRAADETLPNTAGAVTVDTIPAVTAMVLPMTGSLEQHAEAIPQLMKHVVRRGVIRGAPFGVYHSNPEEVPEDSLLWEVCVAVSAGTEATAPFELREFPEMLAAVVVCTGPYAGTGPCYGVLTEWIAENEYDLVGSPQEHWVSAPQGTAPEEMQVRILYPVTKR
jgi:AraC family transcriptional regulator